MRYVAGLAIAAVALATVGLVGSVLAPLVPVWPLELFAHFRLHYIVIGVAIAASAAALRMGGWFDAAAFATLINLWIVAPDLSASQRAVPDGIAVRVLVLNVHTGSSAFADVRQLIADTHPDIIGLVEVDQRWLTALAPAVASYPHRIERPRDDNFGVALYTRAPLTGSLEELGTQLPTAVATVDLQGTRLALVLTHPLPPVNRANLASQYAQLDAIVARANQFGPRVVLMGDLNATPWSRPFRRLVAATGLCDTRAGFGVQASFPAASRLLRIPIDHVLASCAIGVRDRVVEREVGSDHLPIVVDLIVPR